MTRRAAEPETEEAKRTREDTEAVAGILSNAMAWKREARYLRVELRRARDRIAVLEETIRRYELATAVIVELHATPPTR